MTFKEDYLHFAKEKNVILDNQDAVKMISLIILDGKNQTVEVHANYREGKTLLVIK